MTVFTIPLRTVSGLNVREHHMARHRRVKAEREAVAWVLGANPGVALPVTVTLTRCAPSNGLDDDNLRGACKGVRDQVAAWLGVDDRDPRVAWSYAQVRGEWAVRVEICAA